MKLQKVLCSCIFGVLMSIGYAHNPNEMQYDFQLSQDTGTLEIHVTPMSLVALVHYLYPETRTKSTIDLEHYLKDFEAYFNKTIDLKLSDNRLRYKLEAHNLYDHDAFLRFDIETPLSAVHTFDMTLTSFTTIYKRIRNTVMISSEDMTVKFALSAKKTHYNYQKKQQSAFSSDEAIYLIFGIGLSTVFGGILLRLKKP